VRCLSHPDYDVLYTLICSLIQAACIAYASAPSYEIYAPGQQPFTALLSSVVVELPAILDRDERDRLAGIVSAGGEKVVEWGAMDGGPGVRSGESWAAA
jgi:coenzyme A diphosphatase NUDT7